MSSSLLKILTLLALIFTLSHYCFHRSFATDTRLKSNCSSSSYAPNSTYEKNLITLFSNLSENARLNTYGFYNTSVGGDGNRSDTVYGLFLCRGDDTKGDCQRCVPNATAQILKDCPNRPVMATIWFVDCMVRYSNVSMFGLPDTSPVFSIRTHQNMPYNASGFMDVVGNTMSQLAISAAKSSKSYAVMKVKFTSFFTVYAMAQCTPDLSNHQCFSCLTFADNQLSFCCTNGTGALVLTPSCNVRYDISPFYAAPPPPPPLSLWRMPAPPLANVKTLSNGKSKASTFVNIAFVILVAILVILVSICVFVIWTRGRKKYDDAQEVERPIAVLIDPPNLDYVFSGDLSHIESLQYDWIILQNATNNFSQENKLGEGGFGSVYKGILENGKEIGVKRLSSGSSQGTEQFKNEVMFVAKLQHKNIVQLLGFCIAGYEKLLVYEYVSNKSLDLLLFDPAKRSQLDWSMRYNIIKGIARGMLYLHEDSQLRIIHRDLKASNILLDNDMNPKISDFGMARNCKVDESQANTSRIAGTFGYMAPEYLLHGEFSVKSDVYSFGILVLETVTGKRNNSFRPSKVVGHISTYVWNNWKEGEPLQVVDPCLGDSYIGDEVKRCIQIGLLCVQGDTGKRPTMASVVFDLNGNSELPVPQEPAFFNSNGLSGTYSSSMTKEIGFAKSPSNSIRLSFGTDVSVS